MPSVIELTNKRKIPMSLPNGQGGMVNLNPGETRLVRGDYAHYERMPKQGMNGLVVKIADGKARLVEAAEKVADPRMVRVTNHRNIPMRLSTGLGQKAIDIGPKETSDPFLAKISTIKQMSGITVILVKDTTGSFKAPTNDAAEKAKLKAAVAEDEAIAKAEKAAEEAEATKTAEAVALAKLAAEEAEKAKLEAVANDPLVARRRELTLPATSEEWRVHSTQLTWPDVRGLCKDVGVRTKFKNKEQLIAAITEKLYPES
jgi:hypothetical protein